MKIGEKHPSPLLLTSWKIISCFWGIIDFDLSGYFIGLAHRKKQTCVWVTVITVMKYNWSDVIDYNNSSSRLWETTKVTVGWLLLVGGCAFPCVTIHHLCPSLHHPFLHPPSILKLHSLDDPDNYLDHPHLDDYLDHLNHPYQLDDLIIYYPSR